MSEEDDKQQLLMMMTEMVTKMQVLLEKQDELADNISKIKEAVYHPDQGLYLVKASGHASICLRPGRTAIARFYGSPQQL